MAKEKKVTRVRDNDSGEFVKKDKAKSDPKGTTVETIRKKPKKLTEEEVSEVKTDLFKAKTTFTENDIRKAIQYGYKLGIK